MSTISLMPINKKIKLTKDYKFKIESRSFLGDSKTILKEAGISVGNELILDEGSKIRVEGFSASVSDKNWPRTKISIYPEGKKQCQCYIDMSQLDGVTWETIEGDAPKEKKEVQRINISNNDYHGDDKWREYGCYHASFGRDNIERNYEGIKLLNVLELTDAEVALEKFNSNIDSDIGEVSVKKGKESHFYKIRGKSVFTFQIIIKPGRMYGKLIKVKDSIWLGNGSYPKEDMWIKICDLDYGETEVQTQDSYKSLITQYLKNKHNF